MSSTSRAPRRGWRRGEGEGDSGSKGARIRRWRRESRTKRIMFCLPKVHRKKAARDERSFRHTMEKIGQDPRALLPGENACTQRAARPAMGPGEARQPSFRARFMWGFTVTMRSFRALRRSFGCRSRLSLPTRGPDHRRVTPLPWALLLAPWRTPRARCSSPCKVLGSRRVAAAAAGPWGRGGRVSRRDGISKRGRPWLEGGALGAVALSLPWRRTRSVEWKRGWPSRARRPLRSLQAIARGRAAMAAGHRGGISSRDGAVGRGSWRWGSRGRACRGVPSARGPRAPRRFFLCTLARLAIFGRPAPLRGPRKPSDLSHRRGLRAVALIVAATPVLVLAPRALAPVSRGACHRGCGHRSRCSASSRWAADLDAVCAAHSRPSWPSLAWAGVLVLPHAHRAMASARTCSPSP